MKASYNLQQNYLLNALSADENERLFPYFELVKLPLGKVLYEPGVKLRYAYFPVTCIVSLLYDMENGASAEMAIVGYEGVIGITLFMAGGALTNRAVVLSDGYAYRLSGHILMQEFNRFGGRRSGVLHDLLVRSKVKTTAFQAVRFIYDFLTYDIALN